jgi:ATP synthase subunit 6
MLFNLLQNLNLLIASPLDQFGTDTDTTGVIENSVTDLFITSSTLSDIISFIGISDVDNFGNWVLALLACFGIVLFDDEDSSESEWEEGNSTVSGLQASIFSANILGMIPGIETATSEASFTFLLSIAVMVVVTVVGFSLHSIRYIGVLYPTGTPTAMAPFIILIEFISYVARAVSLGMRLFANMFAGHSLVKILMSFAWLFLSSVLPIISLPVFILLLAIFMLECGIAYLQSYVFATLTGMYLEDVISGGH